MENEIPCLHVQEAVHRNIAQLLAIADRILRHAKAGQAACRLELKFSRHAAQWMPDSESAHGAFAKTSACILFDFFRVIRRRAFHVGVKMSSAELSCQGSSSLRVELEALQEAACEAKHLGEGLPPRITSQVNLCFCEELR